MSYIAGRINRALERAKKNLREQSKPCSKHKKRVRNRNKLHERKLKLGRARK